MTSSSSFPCWFRQTDLIKHSSAKLRCFFSSVHATEKHGFQFWLKTAEMLLEEPTCRNCDCQVKQKKSVTSVDECFDGRVSIFFFLNTDIQVSFAVLGQVWLYNSRKLLGSENMYETFGHFCLLVRNSLCEQCVFRQLLPNWTDYWHKSLPRYYWPQS